MRPVNLIPSEERPGSHRPMRGGPIAYVIVGALAALLIGVIVLVLSNNQISEREAEVASVQADTQAAEAQAQKLAAYTEFHSIREQRVATVTSLANSRFDWERVMRELALVLPGNVWLTNLAGTVTPQVSPSGAPSVALRSTVPGPALEMVGCARDQNAVAGFVQALKQIDGATRVGVQFSKLGFAGANSGGGSTTSTCQTRRFLAQFQIVVAFDAAPVPETAAGEGASAPAPPPAEESGSESGEATNASSSEGSEE